MRYVVKIKGRQMAATQDELEAANQPRAPVRSFQTLQSSRFVYMPGICNSDVAYQISSFVSAMVPRFKIQ